MDLNKPLLEKIAEKIVDDVFHSEKYNCKIYWSGSFTIDEYEIEAKYTSELLAYDFMVISGKIESLDVKINDEPCLCIEERYITERVNYML